MFIVLAPDELQVNGGLQLSLTQERKMDMQHYDFEEPQRIITAELRKSGISVIDLLSSFQNVQPKEALYIEQDTHWNDAGNQLAAEILWSHLNEVVSAKAAQ